MSHSTSHFDLFDYIKGLPNVTVAAQMAQGLAWKIDTMLQQASREIFRHVRQDLFIKGVDGLAELSIALREAKFAAESFADAGSSTTGAVQQIGELWHFRDAAHEMAQELTALTTDWMDRPISYVIPDIDDVFHGEVNMKVKPETRRRLAISTQRRAAAFDLTPDEVQAQINKKIERKQEQLKDVGLALQDQAGAVYELFRIARDVAAAKPGDEVNFWNLDLNTQRALIDHSVQNADRAEDRATDNTNLADSEFDEICMTVLKVNKDLRAILKTPRFVIAERVAEAG